MGWSQPDPKTAPRGRLGQLVRDGLGLPSSFGGHLNLTSSPLETVYIEKTGVNLRPFDLEIGLKKPKPGNGGPEESALGLVRMAANLTRDSPLERIVYV